MASSPPVSSGPSCTLGNDLEGLSPLGLPTTSTGSVANAPPNRHLSPQPTFNQQNSTDNLSPGSSGPSAAYMDPPRPAKDGYEWVWFPAGYWAEREIVETAETKSKKSTRWARLTDSSSGRGGSAPGYRRLSSGNLRELQKQQKSSKGPTSSPNNTDETHSQSQSSQRPSLKRSGTSESRSSFVALFPWSKTPQAPLPTPDPAAAAAADEGPVRSRRRPPLLPRRGRSSDTLLHISGGRIAAQGSAPPPTPYATEEMHVRSLQRPPLKRSDTGSGSGSRSSYHFIHSGAAREGQTPSTPASPYLTEEAHVRSLQGTPRRALHAAAMGAAAAATNAANAANAAIAANAAAAAAAISAGSEGGGSPFSRASASLGMPSSSYSSSKLSPGSHNDETDETAVPTKTSSLEWSRPAMASPVMTAAPAAAAPVPNPKVLGKKSFINRLLSPDLRPKPSRTISNTDTDVRAAVEGATAQLGRMASPVLSRLNSNNNNNNGGGPGGSGSSSSNNGSKKQQLQKSWSLKVFGRSPWHRKHSAESDPSSVSSSVNDVLRGRTPLPSPASAMDAGYGPNSSWCPSFPGGEATRVKTPPLREGAPGGQGPRSFFFDVSSPPSAPAQQQKRHAKDRGSPNKEEKSWLVLGGGGGPADPQNPQHQHYHPYQQQLAAEADDNDDDGDGDGNDGRGTASTAARAASAGPAAASNKGKGSSSRRQRRVQTPPGPPNREATRGTGKEWWEVPVARPSYHQVTHAQQPFEFDLPEHLPNSPMCPANKRHRSGGTGVCVYHGRRRRPSSAAVATGATTSTAGAAMPGLGLGPGAATGPGGGSSGHEGEAAWDELWK
ncbi:hypothetical protein GGR56DRAFT_689724 [Xylariaceae sp. FL0804]|nr:hypothetical protein GGR56DRAFT_689724 [Xylariaceae sp. FL0804]